MSDSWCSPLKDSNGNMLYGGAARNARIARSGGMDAILIDVAMEAANNAFKKSNAAFMATNVISKFTALARTHSEPSK